MTILWFFLFIFIFGLIFLRLATLKIICPICKERKLNNFEDSELIDSNEEMEIYEISQKCTGCNYQKIWYIKRVFDLHGKPKDHYLDERPEIQDRYTHE